MRHIHIYMYSIYIYQNKYIHTCMHTYIQCIWKLFCRTCRTPFSRSDTQSSVGSLEWANSNFATSPSFATMHACTPSKWQDNKKILDLYPKLLGRSTSEWQSQTNNNRGPLAGSRSSTVMFCHCPSAKNLIPYSPSGDHCNNWGNEILHLRKRDGAIVWDADFTSLLKNSRRIAAGLLATRDNAAMK